MNYSGTIPVVFLALILAALPGCNSKKDKTAAVPAQTAGQAQPQQKGGQAQPQQKGGAVVASPQDEKDAAILKDRVLAQVKAGDYVAIYNGASEGFKKVGTEKQFEALWRQQVQLTGAFKSAKELSHSVRPADKFIVYIFEVQYEKYKRGLRMVFGRSKAGKMELTGINQRELGNINK